MIALEAVRQRFGAFSLSLSLQAARGEYLVILGPSGCGKSLLLGIIAGLYRPAAGRVKIAGEDVTSWPTERRGVGFVFQKTSLFPHLSVAENIAFGLRVRGRSAEAQRERVAELAARFGLQPLMERPVVALSGGEAQRVAIARALAPAPPLLLLDEPLSLIDHNARLELQEELRRLHSTTGLTVLHVTHNREEARALGQRCAVMLGGRIIQAGALDELFARPRCPFVSRFLGAGDVPNTDICNETCWRGTGACDGPPVAETREAGTP